jgi:hypothetical protein
MVTTTGAPGKAKQADRGRARVARTRPSHRANPAPQLPARGAAPRAPTRQSPAPSSTYQPGMGHKIGTLVEALAPALGLDPARVRVAIVPTSSPLHGYAAAAAITLSGSLNPASPETRALLLHELVHVRQQVNRGTTTPDLTAAESEAAGLANALREGRPLWIPRQVLPDGHTARADGAQGVAPAAAGEPTTPDVASLEETLDMYVAANHSTDVRTISGLLDHRWTQLTSEMIENSLRILSALEFVVARALVRALKVPDRRKLAQLGDRHHEKYPEACIAVLSALTTDDLTDISTPKVTPVGPIHIATTAFHGVDPTRLSAIAMRAVLATLRRLSIGTLTQLEKSDKGNVFRQLFQTGPDTGTDEPELRKAIEREKALATTQTGGDELLYDKVSRLLRDADEENAREALTALEPVCGLSQGSENPGDKPAVSLVKQPPSLDDLRAAVGKPVTTGTGSNAPPKPPDGVITLIGRLDTAGLIAKLIDKLTDEDRRGDKYGPILKVVLAARAPVPNLAKAIELLNYGIFDWKIWDTEARLAYLLVRSTPITAQDAWRQLDNGKWMSRLEDNLPDDMWSSGEYTGVGSEYTIGGGDDLGVPSKLLQDYADALIRRYDDLKIPLIARNIMRELLGLDDNGKPKPWLTQSGVATKQDPSLRIAVIRRIDARQRLNEIIAKLPDDYLFGEQGRIELLDLNQLRDPVQLTRQALSLAPSGFGWLTFTHRDAWIAVQAIRALSPGDQQRFAIENPDIWAMLWIGLTAEMRAALPTTLATGRDERLTTRAGLRERLSDERLWTEANADVLRALVNLGHAADDRAWVFDKSKELRADQRAKGNPKLTALVADFKLYSEADKRTVYVAEQTVASNVPVWAYALGVVGRGLGILAYDLLIDPTVSLSVMGKTMHLKGFDLGDVQTSLGGDIEGVRVDRSEKSANKINVDATFEAGFIVNVDLKDLEIAGVNIVLPGKSYKCGPVSVKGLRVSAGFSDRGYHDPAYVALVLDSLALHDLVLIDPTLPLSGAWAVSRLGLQKMNLRASQDGADDPLGKVGQQLPKGTIPIPVFGPLFQAVKNIVAIKGGIPGDYTLLDYAMIPLNIPFPTSTAISKVANAAFTTPQPLTDLWGLATDGVLRPPYSASQRMEHALGMLRAYNVSFTSLYVDGITLGSGQQIKSLLLTDVNIGYGQSLAGYLGSTLRTIRDAQAKLDKNSQQYKDLEARAIALEAQIKNVEASPRLNELRDKREKDPDHLTDDEKKELAVADKKLADEDLLRRLEVKDRWAPGSLTEDERKQLVELTAKLRADVGLSAEIGSITLGPLTGNIQAAGVTLKGIHLQARLPNIGVLPYAPGYLDDKSLIEQFLKGGPKVPTIGELAKSSGFSLTIDEATLAATDPKQPAVIFKADKLPEVTEVQDTIAKLPEIEGNKPIRDRLNQALDMLVALERARGQAQYGATEKIRADAAQQVRELTDDAQRLLGIEIGGLKIGRITGELDPSTGTLKATVHDTVITRLAGPGFAVDKITGALELGVTAGGVTARRDQLNRADTKPLTGQLAPTLGLSAVTAEGVHLPQGLIKTAKLGVLKGSLKTTDKGYRVPDLFIDFFELDDIALGMPGDGITGTMARLEGVHLDVEVELAPQDAKDTGAIKKAIIHSLRIGAISGQNVVLDMPQEDGTIHAELLDGSVHDISADEVVLDKSSDGWELLQASGSVGYFTDVRYSVLLSSVKSGMKSIKGTLQTTEAPIEKKRPTIMASYVKAEGRKISLRVTDLRALGTEFTTPDGKVTIRTVTIGGKYDATESGAKASATLTNLVLGPIDWKVGAARLHGSGPLTARQVTVAAFATPDVPAKDGKPAKKGAWSVTDIVITALEGTDLRYTDPPIDMHLGREDLTAKPGEAPLRIGRVHIVPAMGKFDIADPSVDVGGNVKKSLHVNGHLGLDSLTVELNRGGHLIAVLKGVSAEATVSGDYSGTVELKGSPGATIDVGPDGITIGSDDPADPGGLRIEQISLTSLDITSALGGHKFHLKTQTDGRVDLLGIRAKVRFDKWKPGEVHKSKSPWKQVAFERFYIERINLGAFQIDLPADDVTIVVPARKDTDPPSLHRLDLTSPIGTDPALLHPDFTIDWDTAAIEGTASVTDIALPIQARIKDKFKGDVTLTTWTSSIGFLAGGGIQIDVEHPQLTMAKAAELGKDKTIRIAKLGADSLSFADGRLYVKGPYIQDLEYRQMIGSTEAVWIKVKNADLKELNYDTKAGGDLFIPTLDIADAYIALNLAALTKKDPTESAPPPPSFDISKLRPAIDELDGDVKVVLYVSASAGNMKDFRIGTEADPLVVPIQGGTVHIPTLEENVKGTVHATQIGSGWYIRPWLVNVVAEDPILRLDGSQLQLGVYLVDPPKVNEGNDELNKNRPRSRDWVDILTWDLHRVDLERARADRFSLWAAIFDLHKSPKPTKEEQEKETDEQRKQREKKEKETQAVIDSLEIRALTADLSIKNRGPLPLTISSDSIDGTVTLSDNALMNLHVSGGIPAVTPPPKRPGTNPGALEIGFDALKVDKVDLTVYDLESPDPNTPGALPKVTGIRGLKTGTITINNLTDASISFNDLFHPQRFSGTITSARAENIRWFKY